MCKKITKSLSIFKKTNLNQKMALKMAKDILTDENVDLVPAPAATTATHD